MLRNEKETISDLKQNERFKFLKKIPATAVMDHFPQPLYELLLLEC